MQQVFSGRVTWLSSLRKRQSTPNYSLEACTLRIKQNDSLNLYNVQTIFRPPAPSCHFFMRFRGSKAHINRMARSV